MTKVENVLFLKYMLHLKMILPESNYCKRLKEHNGSQLCACGGFKILKHKISLRQCIR